MHAVLIRLERSNLSRRVWHCVSISVTSVSLFEAVLKHLRNRHGEPQLEQEAQFASREELGAGPDHESTQPWTYASLSLRPVLVILVC